MSNDILFENRLSHLGTTPDRLLRQIEAPPEALVIGYTSQMDGFGTNRSDLDLYVFDDKIQSPRTEQVAVGSVVADVEFSRITELEKAIQFVAGANVDDPIWISQSRVPSLTKVLYRLRTGARLQTSDRAERLLRHVSLDRLGRIMVRYYILAVDDAAEDAVRHFEAGNYLSAVHMGRRALDFAVLAYLANAGALVFKLKWIYQALTMHLGPAHPITVAFYQYHFDAVSADTAGRTAERMIRHWEKIVNDLG